MAASDQISAGQTDPAIWISKITLNDGTEIVIPRAGVTAIVGGNNSGKSTLLGQIGNWVTSSEAHTPPLGQYQILSSLVISRSGTSGQFLSWVKENSYHQRPTVGNPHLAEGYARAGVSALSESAIQFYWENSGAGRLGPLSSFLVYYAGAAGRSGSSFSAGKRQRPGDSPLHFIHYLEDSNAIRLKVGSLFNEIFGEDLTLDKLGQTSYLRIGTPPASLEKLRYYSDADDLVAREDLDKLPMLDGQGDGMKALMGLLLPVVTAAYPIIIVDEPEAFLHPPQASKLGRILGDLARENGIQVILATHDRNILIGLLESKAQLSVVRLVRSGAGTRSYRLDPKRIEEIWSDPVLRYSHVLDGLFHRLVVAAENERDCTFYAAALDAAHEELPLPMPPSEVLFVPTGGKDGLAPVVAALAEIKVPVVACADIDVLDDKAKMKRIVEALGSSWGEFESEYVACTGFLRVPRSPILVTQVGQSVREFIDGVVKEDPYRKWDDELKDKLRVLSRTGESRWVELKRHGLSAFPPDLGSRPRALLDRLDKIGLVIVSVGTLESFAFGYDGIPRKGIEWLRIALERGVHQGNAATRHARRLAARDLG